MRLLLNLALSVLSISSIGWLIIYGCRPTSARLQDPPGGSITGRVIDANGKPAFQTEVRILAADEAFADHHAVFAEQRRYTYIDQNGTYAIPWVRPGRYIVAVNADFRHAYPTTYWPGVLDLSQAKVIIVKEGDKLVGVDIELPLPSLTRWELRGMVIWPDGRLAGGATVGLLMARYPWIMPYSSDASGDGSDDPGHFLMYGYTKYEYYVMAYATGGDNKQVHAEPTLVSAKQTTGPVQLVLTSPGRLCTHVRPKRED